MTVEAWIALIGVSSTIMAALLGAWRSLRDKVASLDYQLSQIDRELREISRWFKLSGPDNGWLTLPERVRLLEQRVGNVEKQVG